MAYYPRHVVVSPPVGEFLPFSDTAVAVTKRLREVGRRAAQAAGLTAGASVVHLHRIRDSMKGEVHRMARYRKVHRWEVVRTWYPSWLDVVFWSPHLHMVAYGKVDLDAFRKAFPGWVLRVVRRLPGRDAIQHVSFYLLSHAPPLRTGHVVTYWGGLGYNQLKKTAAWRVAEPCLCPECGAPMVRYDPAFGVTDEEFIFKQSYATFKYIGPPL